MATIKDATRPLQQEVETVDLGGDVTLLVGCGDSHVRLRVSGALLSLVSKYFATLFSATFKEGGDAASGVPIILAEDYSTAVTMLCKILHMQHELLFLPLLPKQLLDLAIAADKYDCVKPLALSPKSIFPEDGAGNGDFTDVVNLVCASYLLDQPQLFQHFTRSMVKDHTTPFDDLASSSTGQLVPMGVWCELGVRHAWRLS